jgi:hypothetical protein
MQLIQSTVLHTVELNSLKLTLLGKVDKPISGVKFHGVQHHFVETMRLIASPYYCDTVRFEHAHIKDGVQNFRKTSKRISSQTEEMLWRVCNNSLSEIINRIITTADDRTDDEDDVCCYSHYYKLS